MNVSSALWHWAQLRACPFVTGTAPGIGVVLLVALHAAGHGRDVGHPCHHLHLLYLPVARLAVHVGLEMSAMTPVHKIGDGVDAYPGDGFVGLRILGEFLDIRRIAGDALMAGHASGGVGNRDVVTGIRIAMASFTFEIQGGMGLVTKCNRLMGSGRLSFGRGLFTLIRTWGTLLRPQTDGQDASKY